MYFFQKCEIVLNDELKKYMELSCLSDLKKFTQSLHHWELFRGGGLFFKKTALRDYVFWPNSAIYSGLGLWTLQRMPFVVKFCCRTGSQVIISIGFKGKVLWVEKMFSRAHSMFSLPKSMF